MSLAASCGQAFLDVEANGVFDQVADPRQVTAHEPPAAQMPARRFYAPAATVLFIVWTSGTASKMLAWRR